MAMISTVPILGDTTELLVYILPLVGCVLIFYGVFQVVVESKSSARRKMSQRLRGERRSTEDKITASILRRGALGQSKSFADALVGRVKFVPRLQTLLDQCDLDWSGSQTLLNLIGVSLLVFVGLLMTGTGMLLAVLCGAGALGLPLVWLNFKRNHRMNKLTGQLPDVFEMMSQALRAGHSLAGSIQLVYEQMPPPIATEFAQVYHEQNLGVKVEDALQAMANRVDSLDVRFFVTAVMIQRQTGGDLAEVLENISGVIRGRIELAGLVRGLTAEGRLSGWVLFALPAFVFLATMYLNPDYATVLLEDSRGQIMLMVAAGMQLMGIAMIRWIVNIKV